MTYNEINGDLIELAKQGKFDVIAHGCNCFCNMGAGIAPQMAKAFYADKMEMEKQKYKGDINKLGTIDYHEVTDTGNELRLSNPNDLYVGDVLVTIVNCYTQYKYGKNYTDSMAKPLDYEALTLCMRKINLIFKALHIGLPQIGAGLAGGDWERIKQIIQTELKDCNVTIVIYDKK
jgi:O-acetyl-ADP-ribose deacetylase (regulator of RNase III)